MCQLKGFLDFNEVHVALVGVNDFLVVRMILEPLMHVVEGIFLRKLVSEADPEGQKTIEIVRVLLVSLFEGKDGIFVLV